MLEVPRSPRNWLKVSVLSVAGLVGLGLAATAAYVAYMIYQAGLEGFKAPPISTVELSEPLLITDTQTTGGSGGDISTWAVVSSSTGHDAPGIADLVRSQALATGWFAPELDCGGDTPPCRTAEGIVLTDGDGAYLDVYLSAPSWWPDENQPEADSAAWVHLMYEGWGVGRCCDW